MNEELTTQSVTTPLVLKLKKFDDHSHTSHLSTEMIDNESNSILTTSPTTLRVKLKKTFLNENTDEEYINSNSSENLTRPAKRSKKSSSNDNLSNNDEISSQDGLKEDDQILSPSLVLKIRRDSLTTTNSSLGNSSNVETEINRQLLIKVKKPENGQLITNTNSMSTEFLIAEQQNCSTTNETVQQISTSSTDQTNETHTKELLDEALDSVKNVLMQTFKKNLESGGDLNALKSTLGSDEVAEVFLAKLRQSLKRDNENESKTQESNTDNTDTHSSLTPTSSSNPMISPVMNVVSSPSSSPLLPPMSSMLNRTLSPVPSSPQSSQTTVNTTTTTNNNKKKSSTPSTNPNRFDGTTEEELSKRVLSDILQTNLDIVFVGINPSLYAVHKGHHYGGPGNHFWKLLHMSGLIPNAYNANDDYRMPQYGIGFTNIVQRPSKAGSDITKDEITAGAEVLMQKIKMYRPKIVAFNGRGIYEVYAGNKHFHYGKQPDLFLGTDTHVFVMPSSSARCSQLPRAEDKLPFYVGLRKLRDFVNGTLHSLNEAEITFPDIKIKDTDDVLQKTVIRISNKPFSELSAETLKSYGDKMPSGQMISKHIPLSPSPSSSSSSSNLVFNTEALTTQTMSILHNTTQQQQQNGNLFNYEQSSQRIYSQNNGSSSPSLINQQRLSSINGTITTKNSFIDNSTSNTNAAVLAALANGGFNSSSSLSSSSSQSQSTYYQPTQTISYSIPNSTILNSRPSTPTSSYVIHHQPSQTSSPLLSRQLVVVNSSEPLPSIETILQSSSQSFRTQTIPSKDFQSSQSIIPKQTLIVVPPSIKPLTTSSSSSSTIILPKLPNINLNANTNEKRSLNSTDDCLYVRYERESSTLNSDQYRFSFIIDEHSPLLHKRSRYVSINDL